MNNLIDILRAGLFAPKPTPALIWASEGGLKYHIETAQSDAANGETFTALCGFTGLFQHQRNERHTFLRCFDCERIQAQSTTGILDVADHTISKAENQPFKDGTTVGSSGEATATASPLQFLPEPFTLQQTGATASTSLSVVPENFSCFIERIDEFVAVRLPRIADCFCGRPSVHECPCGEPICANHSYDSLCGTCTEAKQLQHSSVMDGESRY